MNPFKPVRPACANRLPSPVLVFRKRTRLAPQGYLKSPSEERLSPSPSLTLSTAIMSRSLFYAVCCLTIIHSSLVLPNILPRAEVTEAKPESVDEKCFFFFFCGWGWGWPVGEGTFESDVDVTWEGPSGEVVYEDTWPGFEWDVTLRSTDETDGGAGGTQKHSVAKSVTQEPSSSANQKTSVAKGGSASKQSSDAQQGNVRSSVTSSAIHESSIARGGTVESSAVPSS
ncbi:hypothetical protein PCASD_10450 [Puccinia coronata f. sp. avenae]|uniref:Uncharacterized protein n=1 Tax=Puccinia coronata f. sp. avenae TaxID=200324 RepID=A0A2N5UES8_9BASI|nr:hypothetical protein PCASD_10450 [Puccinia coronata f. sp. avenae]